MEKLEEHIGDIKADMHKYKGQGGQNDRQRKKLLKDLEVYMNESSHNPI